MAKLVIRFDVGSEYTGCWTVSEPVNYESAEDFLVDYEKWCKDHEGRIICLQTECFAGILTNEQQVNLEVLTVDEWFEKHAT